MAPRFSNDDLVLYIDVAILFVVVLFAIFGFPRLAARLSLPHCEGWLIRKDKPAGSLSQIALQGSTDSFGVKNEKKADSTDSSLESDVAPYQIDLRDAESMKASLALPSLRSNTNAVPKLPVHVRSYTTLLHPLSKIVSARYDGYSVGQYTVLMIYLGVVIVAMFLFSSPVNNITRAGFVCISQAPIVVLLGVKNGPLGALLGKGYEKVGILIHLLSPKLKPFASSTTSTAGLDSSCFCRLSSTSSAIVSFSFV